MNRLLLVVLSVWLYAGLAHQAEGSTAEQRKNVVKFLSGRSHPTVRPDGEGGDGTPVVVHLKYTGIRVLKVDEEKLTMKTNGFLQMRWTDRRLNYQNMRNYRGDGFNVSSVRMDPKDIWVPDIELYSTDSHGSRDLLQRNMALLFPSGEVVYVLYFIAGSNCDPVRNNETITCTIRIGSWTYADHDMNLDVATDTPLDVVGVTPKGNWRLSSTSALREVRYFACCPEGYVAVDFIFNFVRDHHHHDDDHHHH